MCELKVVSLRPKIQTLSVYAPLLRLLEEGRAAMETLQVCEYLYLLRDWKNKTISEDTLVGQGRTTGTGGPGELGPGQTEAAGTGPAQKSPGASGPTRYHVLPIFAEIAEMEVTITAGSLQAFVAMMTTE
jgi:hypothetical protein